MGKVILILCLLVSQAAQAQMTVISRATWPEVERAMEVCRLHRRADSYEAGWESCQKVEQAWNTIQQHRANEHGGASPPDPADDKDSIENIAKRLGK